MRATATRLLSTLILATGTLCGGAALADVAWHESGEATWYGPGHEGRRTSSGEKFDSHKLTAAHASLPLGSFVRVTVASNGRSIVVKVNDREPQHGVRCIDLSKAAAARLGILGRGVADVTLASASSEEAAELAEAPDDAQTIEASHGAGRHRRHVISQHGQRHTRRAHQ